MLYIILALVALLATSLFFSVRLILSYKGRIKRMRRQRRERKENARGAEECAYIYREEAEKVRRDAQFLEITLQEMQSRLQEADAEVARLNRSFDLADRASATLMAELERDITRMAQHELSISDLYAIQDRLERRHARSWFDVTKAGRQPFFKGIERNPRRA